MRVLLAFAILTSMHAQTYRGEAVPVAQRVEPVEFSRLRFLTFVFGREGPMDAPLRTPPVMGRQYFVEADVSGLESAGTVRFEVVDAAGRAIQTPVMWKATDSSSDGEFHGFVTVPNQPFRVAVSGTTRGGAQFRSVLGDPFQPAASGPVETLPALVESYRQQLLGRAAQAVRDHPGGVITLSRAVVSRISYEPLTMTSAAAIGMRLRYSIQFPSRQTINAFPHVFPVYQPTAWRGMATMKPLGGTITPAPGIAGVQSLRETIVYTAQATYEAGVTYSFTLDMMPDWVFQGSETGRFCIHEQKFTNRPVWDALIASQTAVPYSVTIFDTETVANIPVFYPQRTFYESFAAGGAFDCGPTPNIRF